MSEIHDEGGPDPGFRTEAADWFARLRSGTLSELDAARFRAWIASHPERRREFEELDCFWQELRAIESSPEVAIVREPDRLHPARGARVTVDEPRRHSRLFRWGIAASLSIGLAALAWMRLSASNLYATGVGEQRIIPMADGSIVTLNTSSTLRVRYSNSLRVVELIAGQASFEVAQDRHRPFIVKADKGQVRALGTVFDVYKRAGKVIVTLLEGKVTIGLRNVPGTSADGPADDRQVQLTAGQQLSYFNGVALTQPVKVNASHVSAWRVRKLDFDDTRLIDAIADANRYSKLKIDLRAPALEGARVSGTFDAGKNELVAEGLQTYFHLRARRDGDRIVLTPIP